MSGAALSWAFRRNRDRTLPQAPSLKAVRIALARYARESGLAWPSVGTLALETGWTERTIQGALRVMRQLGEIVPCGPTKGGRGLTTTYRLLLLAAKPAPISERQGALHLAETPQVSPQKGESPAPEESKREESKTPSLRDAQPANSVVIESRIEAEATPPLEAIEAEAVPPLRQMLNEIPAPRKRVWLQGVPIVRDLLGVSERQARAFLGGMLKASRDDCAAVIAALEEAADLHPIEPKSWLMAAARERGTPVESQRTRLMRDLRAEFGVPQPTVFERAPSFLEYMQ